MDRYKDYSYSQGIVFIPIHFEKQILPGTFEYSLNHLIDHEVGLGPDSSVDMSLEDGKVKSSRCKARQLTLFSSTQLLTD